VRHANSSYTPDELNRPLSDKGFKDAEKVTKLLSQESITKVIASPYKRAIQTIEGTANHFNLKISIEEGFKERRLAEGAVENVDEVILKYWENFNYYLPMGESGYFAQERGIKALENILNIYDGENVVVGTHGNIMVLMMNYYDKKYNYDFWCNLEMPDIYKLSFEDKKFLNAERIWR
jgi:2,3-bisphosphoglycerate-dependent phosphoglycerate mutase